MPSLDLPSDLPPRTSPTYYPSLDGLRAVAIILVFFQHYGGGSGIKLFGWGWTGVDVFFVLSGFLITGILFDSQHAPHRLRDFYARRTLRIFPLFYAFWLAVLLAAPFAHWQVNWRWGLWPAYLGNYARFLFYDPATPYRFHSFLFGPRIAARFGYPVHLYVGHFWSLCVEEQFYLVWPFVVFHLRSRATLIRVCLVVIVLSPILRAILAFTAAPHLLQLELLYRLLPTRLDALLIGGLLALCLRGPERPLVFELRRSLLFGSALAFLTLYLVSTRLLHLPYTGSNSNWVAILGFSFLDLFAAAVILECIHPGTLLARALTWRPLRLLGLISYGFYTLHDVPHDFYADLAHRLAPAHVWLTTVLLAFLSTLLLATGSYHLLERPFLRLKHRFPGQRHTAPRA